MPKGLYARSLLIVILPMVLLQSAIAYVFMERHWQTVTQRLSSAVVPDIAALVDLLKHARRRHLVPDAHAHRGPALQLSIELAPARAAAARPAQAVLLAARQRAVARTLAADRPPVLDRHGRAIRSSSRSACSSTTGVLRVLTRRNSAYASNSHIFLMWMVATSLVLLGVAIAFLRNQIRPILRLAEAAEEFGKGRDIEFRPRGAREVRQAGYAFIEMKRRIERAIEQRTTMLNGVSHDLRTILTRFKLSLAAAARRPRHRGDAEGRRRDAAHAGGLSRLRARRRGAEQAAPTDMRRCSRN